MFKITFVRTDRPRGAAFMPHQRHQLDGVLFGHELDMRIASCSHFTASFSTVYDKPLIVNYIRRKLHFKNIFKIIKL